MPMKNVGKKAVEKQLKTLSNLSAGKALMETAAKHYKMGNDFFNEKNYSAGYYSYYSSLKEYAAIIVSNKLKTPVESREALNYLVKKKLFGMDKESLKKIDDLAAKVLNRQKPLRENCVFIKEFIVRMRKQVS
jgi:hypothetical protein